MSSSTPLPNQKAKPTLHRSTRALAFVVAATLSAGSASAQFQVNKQPHDDLRSSRLPYPEGKISQIAKEVRSDGWVFFNDNFKEAPEGIAAKYKAAFGLGDADDLRLTTAKKDELAITRYRYTQYHGGLPVEGADFSIYAKADKAVSATGRLVQTLGPAQLPAITERAALAVALASAPAKKYLWQDKKAEQSLRTDKHDSTATNFPKGKLLYALSTNDGNLPSTVHRLAYRFDITRISPEASEAVYIDAQTGQLLRINSLVHHSSCQTNRVDTWYNGTNNLSTWWESGVNGFQLRDYCRGSYILTKTGNGTGFYDWDSNSSFLTLGGSENNPLNTNWNTSFQARVSASAHFGCQVAHYYFQTRFNHTGGTGNGKEFRVVVNNNVANGAAYQYHNDDDYMVIGRVGSTSGNSFAELDIVAHEFTHAVVNGSANLQGYRSEASALNESFADIFGEMSELMHTGQHDWVLGRFAGVPRAFANVAFSLGANPAQVYQGRDWDFNGEEHTNSGVQSRWFYLLSVGGQGDFGVSVTGIGEEKAARIAYRNLTTYLGPNATYANARAGAIQAATDLYGLCSVEATATTNAWAAVGVGAAASFCATDIVGTSTFCLERAAAVPTDYRVSASPGATKYWSNSNPDFSFNALGPIDYVTLTAVPTYTASTTLQVDIQSGGVSATRYLQINSRSCRPQPCPPGIQKCDETYPTTPFTAATATGSSRSVSLYPNPGDASVTLDLATPAIAPTTVHIHDMTGRILYTHYVPVGQQTADLNVAKLPVGSYLLFITSATGTTSQRLLINR